MYQCGLLLIIRKMGLKPHPLAITLASIGQRGAAVILRYSLQREDHSSYAQ